MPGVRKIEVQFDKSLVLVWSKPGETPITLLVKALTGLGYKAWDSATEKRRGGDNLQHKDRN